MVWSLGGAALAQGRGGKGSVKVGMNRIITTGATYTLEDNAGTPSFTNSDSMEGNEVFLEFIFFGRLGLEFGMGLTQMSRSYKLGGSGQAVDLNVEETTRPAVIGLNLYFKDHTSPGFKYFFGLGTGAFSVDHTFSGTGLATTTSSQTVPVNTLKFGMDWITENAGVRLQAISQSGEITDTTTHSAAGYTQTLAYTATVITIGVFAFF